MTGMTVLPRSGGWTVDDLVDLPDDGLRYELVDGTLLVSPAPTKVHQRCVCRLHLLLVATPRPLSYFSWIVGLVTAAATVLPFTTAGSLPIAFAQAIIHLVVGAAIGSLLSGAAANATRPMHVPQNRFHVDEYGD